MPLVQADCESGHSPILCSVTRCIVDPGISMLWLSSSDVQDVVGPGSSMLRLSSSDVQDAPITLNIDYWVGGYPALHGSASLIITPCHRM
ncbi:hypothetical protein L9F63_000946, partial [Diploptera punctata]